MDEEIKVLLIPKDPTDAKNAVMEIRAGTGGDEASIFAGDLYKMYSAFSHQQKVGKRNWWILQMELQVAIKKLFLMSVEKMFTDNLKI